MVETFTILTTLPNAVVAPIHYTLLLWAVVFGYLVFGDVPQPAMLVGAAIQTVPDKAKAPEAGPNLLGS